jgi:hypothetical protein
MQDQVNATPEPKRVPWNKGKLTGAKPPLRPKHVWSIASLRYGASSPEQRDRIARRRGLVGPRKFKTPSWWRSSSSARLLSKAVSSSLARRTPAFCNCSLTTGSFASRYCVLTLRAPLVKSHDDACMTQYIVRADSVIAKDFVSPVAGYGSIPFRLHLRSDDRQEIGYRLRSIGTDRILNKTSVPDRVKMSRTLPARPDDITPFIIEK